MAPNTGSSRGSIVESTADRSTEPMEVWSRQRIDLIKRQVCPKGIGDDEFAVFIAQCQRTGLDPLIREAFCTPRKENIGTRDNPRWITKHVFVPGHDGMLARADRFPDFRGIRGAAVYAKDQFSIDEAEGIVRHLWNPIGDRGEIVGAWAMALRDGRRYPVEWILFDEYRDDRNPKWREQPQTMIVKCARAAALRRAYPNAFGSVYIREEMPQEELPPAANEDGARRPAHRVEASTPKTQLEEAQLVPAADPAAVILEKIQEAKTLAELRALTKEITAKDVGKVPAVRDAYSNKQGELNRSGRR